MTKTDTRKGLRETNPGGRPSKWRTPMPTKRTRSQNLDRASYRLWQALQSLSEAENQTKNTYDKQPLEDLMGITINLQNHINAIANALTLKERKPQ